MNLSDLSDRAYHDIFEALFKTVLEQKPKYFVNRNNANTGNNNSNNKTAKAAELRLTKCAKAVRAAAASANRGSSKVKQKTLVAIIDHITQVLPAPGGSETFVRPLLKDYVKALAELTRSANAEFFARKEGHLWGVCVDFFLDIITHRIPQHGAASHAVDQSLLGRNSPAPGTPRSTLRSTLRSNSGSLLSQKLPSEISEGEPARDALEGLYHLVSAANAHHMSRYQDVANAALQVLRLQHLSMGPLQNTSFSIINTIISATQLDDPVYTESLVRDLLPLMAHWWRADRVSQDDTIKSLRGEILRTILLSQLHIENMAVNRWDDHVREEIEYLLDPIWQEYSKRTASNQLQLSDITFATSRLPSDYLHIGIFGLRPFNTDSESQWAVVQCLASLEAVLLRQKPKTTAQQSDQQQPRKRRRIDQKENRIRAKLRDRHPEVTLTTLQIIPFILAAQPLSAEEVQDLLAHLISFTTHKDTAIASWAIIACSR